MFEVPFAARRPIRILFAPQTAWTAQMDEPWAEWERVAYAR